jgi:2Fe-2S ferredoxin
MPKINFEKKFPSIEVPKGANLRESLLEAGRTVASSCDGEGVCGKCWIRIVEGEKSLTPETEDEKFLKSTQRLGSNFRISCQTKVIGDIKIDTSYW